LAITFSEKTPGRRKVLSDEALADILDLYFENRFSVRKIADLIGVSHMTIHRALANVEVELSR